MPLSRDIVRYRILLAVMRAKTRAEARAKIDKKTAALRRTLDIESSDPMDIAHVLGGAGHDAEAWAYKLLDVSPGDRPEAIKRLANAGGEYLGPAVGKLRMELSARLRVWFRVATGEVPPLGTDMFAIAERYWRSVMPEYPADDVPGYGEWRAGGYRQGWSPILEVLLNENAGEAAEAAYDALDDAKVWGLRSWLTKAWVTDRVIRRIDHDQLAREASREIAATLAESGKTELSVAWSLLGATPRNQMSFWAPYVAINTMHELGVLGEMSADEARQVRQAIDVLQLCAEGAFVSEPKSLWDIMRPLLRDEAEFPDLPVLPRQTPLPRPRPAGPRVPSVKVVSGTASPTVRSETKMYDTLFGADIPLVVARGVSGIRQTLRSEYPHAQNAIDLLMRDVVEGKPVRINPVLLTGPAGTGKSRLARRFSELLGLHAQRVDGASASDSQFGGVPRGWHSTMPSVPLRAVHRSGHANPVVIVDEVEKAASATLNGRLWDSLMPYMERETSARLHDVCLDTPVDLSWVSYIATSNDDTILPPPLRDRFRVVNVPLPELKHLPQLAMNVVADIERQEGTAGFNAPLAPDELQVIGAAWKSAKFSIRALQKIVQATLDARAAFQMRH